MNKVVKHIRRAQRKYTKNIPSVIVRPRRIRTGMNRIRLPRAPPII